MLSGVCCELVRSPKTCATRRGTSRRHSRSPASTLFGAWCSSGCRPHPASCGSRNPSWTLGAGSAKRSMRSGGSVVRLAAVSGMSLASSARFANGRCARAGDAGRCASGRRRGSWWRRWGCWRHTTGMGDVDPGRLRENFAGCAPPRLRTRFLTRCCGGETDVLRTQPHLSGSP